MLVTCKSSCLSTLSTLLCARIDSVSLIVHIFPVFAHFSKVSCIYAEITAWSSVNRSSSLYSIYSASLFSILVITLSPVLPIWAAQAAWKHWLVISFLMWWGVGVVGLFHRTSRIKSTSTDLAHSGVIATGYWYGQYFIHRLSREGQHLHLYRLHLGNYRIFFFVSGLLCWNWRKVELSPV